MLKPTRKYILPFLILLVLSACSWDTTLPSELLTATTAPVVIGEAVSEDASPADEPTQRPPTLEVQVAPPVEEKAQPPQGYGPDNFPANVNPLTGKVVRDVENLERRPVSVKINNYPRSNRPQWGLSLADIVYEYYHNNDLPRFHAIFYGNDAEMAGPIRSGRHFDDYLVQMYKSHFAFGSADSRILDHFKAQDYANRLEYLLDGECPPTPVCRYDPGGYNFLVASTDGIRAYTQSNGADDQRQNLDGMWFSEGLPQGGKPGTQVYVRYSYGAYLYWLYDPTTGRYLRYQDTQEDIQGRGEEYAQLTDRLTGEPIAADNVVVLVIEHFHRVYQPPKGSNPAVEIVDMKFEGAGQAYAFRDGQWFDVRWVRDRDDAVFTLVFPDGSDYPYKPGTTWYQVISLSSEMQKLEKGIYRFVFYHDDI